MYRAYARELMNDAEFEAFLKNEAFCPSGQPWDLELAVRSYYSRQTDQLTNE